MVDAGQQVSDLWPRHADVGDRLIRATRFTSTDPPVVVAALGATDSNVAQEIAWFDEGSARFGEPLAVPSWILDLVPVSGADAALVATDGSAIVCSRREGTAERLCPFGEGSAWELAADRSARTVAGAFLEGREPLHVLDFESARATALGAPSGDAFARMFPRVAISDSGRHVALSFGFRATGVWQAGDGSALSIPAVESSIIGAVGPSVSAEQLTEALPLTGAMARRVWISRDEARLAVAGMIPYRSLAPFMCLWLVALDDMRPGVLLNLDSTMAGVDLTPDFGLCIASAGQNRSRLSIWDVAAGKSLADFDAGVDDVTDLRISGCGSRVGVVGKSAFCLHHFAARHWQNETDREDGFWMIDLNGTRSFTPVGRDDFEGRFAALMNDRPGEWRSAVAVAESLTGGRGS